MKVLVWASGLLMIVSATPAAANTKQVEFVADTAVACLPLMTASGSVAVSLKELGWKDITPVLNGRSMAAMTGSSQFRKGSDQALVSVPGSMVDANCQFDFAKVPDSEFGKVVALLDQKLGLKGEPSADKVKWHKDGMVLVSIRSGQKVTMLWLPEPKEGK